MKPYKSEGIILLQRQLKEADRLVVIWTHNEGKKAFIVKGANKILGKKISALDTLNHIAFSALAGKSEQQLLIEATIINDFTTLKKNYAAVSIAMYMLELLDRFLATEENYQSFYRLFLEIITTIDIENTHLNLYLIYFQLHLLINTGFAPSLNNCIVCYDGLEEAQDRIPNDSNEPGYICEKHFDNINKQLVFVSDTIIKIQKYLSRSLVRDVIKLNASEDDIQIIFNIQNTWIEGISERTINSKTLLKIWKKQEK